jgi:ribokinase
MARFLQKLLDAQEPLFTIGLRQLEKATGHSGVDTRLIADMTHKAHAVMRRLGLDPADTTGPELYHTLNTTVPHGTAIELLGENDYILVGVNDETISFNLIDVIENAHHGLSFEQRVKNHGQRSLRGEIVKRYLDHARTDDLTARQIAEASGLLPKSDEGYVQYNVAALTATPTHSDTSAPYILAIGDIVTDAFIKLLEDQAAVSTDEHGTKRLSMEFGNKPPYDRVDIVQAVGNSANAAVAFTRLGLRSGLMAYLGDDQPGKDSLTYLASERVDTQPLSVQEGMKSNYHYALRYGADRTILIKYEDYNYAWQEPATTPDWVYLSMISESAWQLHLDMLSYLEAHPETKLVFQPGTFHFKWGAEKLADVYRRSHIVFMNREEAGLVTGMGIESVAELATALHTLGPQIVVITDGPDGAYASDGTSLLKMPNYPDPAPPYDRTGAGDAFASTVVAALALGKSLDEALHWAPINSMSVVQKLGAQAGLLRREELDTYLQKAPEDYHSEELA